MKSWNQERTREKKKFWPFILINLQYNHRNAHGIALAMRKNTDFFRVNWKAIEGVLPHSSVEVSFWSPSAQYLIYR